VELFARDVRVVVVYVPVLAAGVTGRSARGRTCETTTMLLACDNRRLERSLQHRDKRAATRIISAVVWILPYEEVK
jgi:hypothetical protein